MKFSKTRCVVCLSSGYHLPGAFICLLLLHMRPPTIWLQYSSLFLSHPSLSAMLYSSNRKPCCSSNTQCQFIPRFSSYTQLSIYSIPIFLANLAHSYSFLKTCHCQILSKVFLVLLPILPCTYNSSQLVCMP